MIVEIVKIIIETKTKLLKNVKYKRKRSTTNSPVILFFEKQTNLVVYLKKFN